MFETSEETQDTSPLQNILYTVYTILRLDRIIKENNNLLSNKEDVEDAATGEK